MFFKFPLKIPTWSSSTNEWSYTTFEEKQEFVDYMWKQFKLPGRYNLRKEVNLKIQEEGLKYSKTANSETFQGGRYHPYVKNSIQYNKWHETQKERVLKGVIYDEFYVPPYYYWYLNFCPFYDDIKMVYRFGDIWDTDLWYFHYVTLCILLGKNVYGVKGRQKGFEQPNSELILTTTGWKQMGDLSISDKVYSVDGLPTDIQEIFHQGKKDVYRVSLRDGRNVLCGENHLWSVYNIKSKKQHDLVTLSTKELIEKDIAFTSSFKGKGYKSYKFLLPSHKPIEFKELKELPIDPYVLGVIIGDGSISETQVRISSTDEEIFNEVIKRLGEKYEYSNTEKGACPRKSIKYKDRFAHQDTDKYGINPIIRSIKHLGLSDKNCYSKFIPDVYLNNSTIEQRIDLLRGLMDTDGYINTRGKDLHFTTTSKTLAENVTYLCRSLGISTSISNKKSKDDTPFYRVRIHPEDINPFKLERKAKRFKIKKNTGRTAIVNIEKLSYQEKSTCITINHPSQLYITRDFIVTHNSLKHTGFLYWGYCWFGGGVYTIGAIDESLVEKSWIFLERYRNHINKYTPWKRGPVKPKSLEWEETMETKKGNVVGGGAKLSGVTFKQSPTKDVGGVQTIFNYEEPGISPTITETYSFIKPAMKKGSVKTGIFVACGSVGNLEDAEGLKKMVYDPASYDGLPIKNVWDDDASENSTCGIFISEAYSMLGEDWHYDDMGKIVGGTGKTFIDEAGNSDVELALEWIKKNDELLQNSKKTEHEKQIDRSQKCTSPKQAFAERKVNYFPVNQLRRRQEQLKILEQEGKHKPQKGLLYLGNDGKIKLDKEHGPEHEYPIKPEWPDKRGCVTIYYWPEENPKKYIYFAGVDTVEADETTTSESIQTVDIFQGQTIVKDENGKILRIEGDKLVATFRGRFNPVDGGNEQAWLLLKLYNAYCYQERSKPNFQSYMKRNGWAEQYLAKEAEVQMYKDVNFYKEKPDAGLYGFVINANNNVWDTFKKIGKEYLYTEYGRETIIDAEGNEKVLKTYTGIDRIEDYWLLEEFIQYAEDKAGRPKKNTDRLVSFLAAVTLAKVFQNSHTSVKVEISENAKKPKQVYSPKPINMLGGYPKKSYNNTKGRKPISMI